MASIDTVQCQKSCPIGKWLGKTRHKYQWTGREQQDCPNKNNVTIIWIISIQYGLLDRFGAFSFKISQDLELYSGNEIVLEQIFVPGWTQQPPVLISEKIRYTLLFCFHCYSIQIIMSMNHFRSVANYRTNPVGGRFACTAYQAQRVHGLSRWRQCLIYVSFCHWSAVCISLLSPTVLHWDSSVHVNVLLLCLWACRL